MFTWFMSIADAIGDTIRIDPNHMDSTGFIQEAAHIDIPIWMGAVIASIIIGLVVYIWHRSEKAIDGSTGKLVELIEKLATEKKQIEVNTRRLDMLEVFQEDVMKKGHLMTVEEHGRACITNMQTLMTSIKEYLDQQFTSQNKWIEAKFDAIDDKIENRVIAAVLGHKRAKIPTKPKLPKLS